MARVANPYYSDPSIGAGFSNLAAALFGDPEAAGQYAYQQARTNLANQDLADKQRVSTATQELGDLIGGFQPGLAEQFPDVGRQAVLAGYDPSDLASLILTLTSNMGAGDDAVARSLVGTGQTLSPDRSEEHTSELQSLMRISYAV